MAMCCQVTLHSAHQTPATGETFLIIVTECKRWWHTRYSTTQSQWRL